MKITFSGKRPFKSNISPFKSLTPAKEGAILGPGETYLHRSLEGERRNTLLYDTNLDNTEFGLIHTDAQEFSSKRSWCRPSRDMVYLWSKTS